jgi:hypothetical protein
MIRHGFPSDHRLLNRREMLCRSGAGFGGLALAGMLGAESRAAGPLSPRRSHFPARAKRVIFLFMHGGPSQVDTFDYKPLLERDDGKPLPFPNDYGYYAVENKVHVHDLHATMLHLLGLDHRKLTYRHAGGDFRLTDVHGNVVKDVLARSCCRRPSLPRENEGIATAGLHPL